MLGNHSIGDMIQDRYLVRNILSGGMGLVYICYDQRDKDFVAVKTILDRLRFSLTHTDRFITEAKIWLSLGTHPNIVKVYKVEVVEGQLCIFMEYIAGHSQYGSSLRSWILRKAPAIDASLEIALQVCSGLTHAQDLVPGIVHRDLKPENILITQAGVAKVTDFGLAKAAGDSQDAGPSAPTDEFQETFHARFTRIGHVVGTPPYMSPEQCQGAVLDSRSDIYSVGCILFEMFTGRWLLESNDPQKWREWHVYGEPVAPSRINHKIPRFLDGIVLRCLEKKPNRRYPSTKELASDLSEAYSRLSGRQWRAANDSFEHSKHSQEKSIEKANSYVDLGMTDKALLEIDGVLRKDPRNLEALQVKSRILGAAGKTEEMLSLCERILMQDSSSAKAQNNRGTALLQQNRPNEALAAFQSAITLDPTLAAAWGNLGIYYTESGDTERSLQCIEQALKLNRWNSIFWLSKARALNEKNVGKRGRDTEVSLCLEQALIYSNTDRERAELALRLSLEVPTIFRDDEHLYGLALRSLQNLDIGLLSKSFAPRSLASPLVNNEISTLLDAHPVLGPALGKAAILFFTSQFTLRVTGSLSEAMDGSDLMLAGLQEELRNYSLDGDVVEHFFSYLRTIRSFLLSQTLSVDLNRGEEAVELLLGSLEHTSDILYRHYVWMLCGQILFEMKNWCKALVYLRKAVKFDSVGYPCNDKYNPNSREVAAMIAACERALGHIDDAKG